MKKLYNLSLKFQIVLLLLATSSQFALCEDSTGNSNGGDRIGYERSAWFLGSNKNIRYCIEQSPNFGVTPEFAKKAVQASFDAWKKYVNLRMYFDVSMSPAHRPMRGIYPIVFDGVLQASCNGAEDLKFYLGGHNIEIDNAIEKYNNPIALAEKRSYDKAIGWGNGFIWLTSPEINDSQAPDVVRSWKLGNSLVTVITHELGHVFGCEHFSGTIMDSDVFETAFGYKSDPLPNLSLKVNIDGNRELNECAGTEVCEAPYELKTINDGFRLLVGANPQGKVKAQFIRRRTFMPADPLALLVLGDDRHSYNLPLSMVQSSTPVASNEKMFLAQIYDFDQNQSNYEMIFQEVTPMTVLKSDGSKISIEVRYNFGDDPIEIRFLDPQGISYIGFKGRREL